MILLSVYNDHYLPTYLPRYLLLKTSQYQHNEESFNLTMASSMHLLKRMQ